MVLVIPNKDIRGEGHIVTIFNSKLKNKEKIDEKEEFPLSNRDEVFVIVDPSLFKELDFIENMAYSLNFLNPSFIKDKFLIERKERIKRD